jgi:hypothetical protein
LNFGFPSSSAAQGTAPHLADNPLQFAAVHPDTTAVAMTTDRNLANGGSPACGGEIELQGIFFALRVLHRRSANEREERG